MRRVRIESNPSESNWIGSSWIGLGRIGIDVDVDANVGSMMSCQPARPRSSLPVRARGFRFAARWTWSAGLRPDFRSRVRARSRLLGVLSFSSGCPAWSLRCPSRRTNTSTRSNLHPIHRVLEASKGRGAEAREPRPSRGCFAHRAHCCPFGRVPLLRGARTSLEKGSGNAFRLDSAWYVGACERGGRSSSARGCVVCEGSRLVLQLSCEW